MLQEQNLKEKNIFSVQYQYLQKKILFSIVHRRQKVFIQLPDNFQNKFNLLNCSPSKDNLVFEHRTCMIWTFIFITLFTQYELKQVVKHVEVRKLNI